MYMTTVNYDARIRNYQTLVIPHMHNVLTIACTLPVYVYFVRDTLLKRGSLHIQIWPSRVQAHHTHLSVSNQRV
jgi:hypothetical protein